jgi:hypothetical protein
MHKSRNATSIGDNSRVQQFAPIALFAYRRTKALSRTLDALEACPEFVESPVFVFSDAPIDVCAARDVDAVRALVRNRLRSNMTLVEREKNLGLAGSIIDGVTRICNEYGRVIVIEDDLIVMKGALTWLNAGLDRFAAADKVWQVVLHQWDVPEYHDRPEGLFLNLTSSWGWATWKRAWDRFDLAASGWTDIIENTDLRSQFDIGGAYPYSDMLQRAMCGSVDSWAVRFWWSVFRAQGVCLFPPRPLITNIGFDSMATNFRYGFVRRLFKRRGAPARTGPQPQLPNVSATELPEDRAALSRTIVRSRDAGLLGGLL